MNIIVEVFKQPNKKNECEVHVIDITEEAILEVAVELAKKNFSLTEDDIFNVQIDCIKI